MQELTERRDLAVEGANLGVGTDYPEPDVTSTDADGLSWMRLPTTLETWEERVHPAYMDRVEDALEAHTRWRGAVA